MDELTRSHLRLGKVFVKLSAIDISLGGAAGLSAKNRQARWAKQIFIKTESMRTLAQQLGELCRNEIRETQSQAFKISILLSAGIIIGVAIILFLLGRSIVNALSVLRDDTEFVGTGNLDHQVNIEGKDEIGDLSRAFHDMILRLKSVTASRDQLDNEIKSREQAESELGEKETVVEAVLTNMDQGVIMYDSDLIVTAFNEQARELMRFPEDVLFIGASFKDLASFAKSNSDRGTGDTESLSEERWENLREGRPHSLEYVHSDGTVIEIRRRSIPGGGFVVTQTDITERKRSEDVLRESEARLLEILDHSPYGVSIVSQNSKERLYMNRRYIEMLGGEPGGEVPEQTIGESFDDPAKLEENWAAFERNGLIVDNEERRKRLDGTTWWCLSEWRPIKFGAESAVMIWHSDITERKEAVGNLEKTLRQAEQFNRLTVNRELRMIEMKKEVNELLEKIGEEPQYFK
ncbi:MAG: PAS-domain containing protein [Alphaproteobacteria bacterium]|nr:PAS-domain containing protein [Alphaproteobacteria bacterium]